MTDEEIKKLMVLIKKAAPLLANGNLEAQIVTHGTFENGVYTMLNVVEKVISNFCNKIIPPEGLITDFKFTSGVEATIKIQELDEDYYCEDKQKKIIIRTKCDNTLFSWAASIEELTSLRDNCNKMLEYLSYE